MKTCHFNNCAQSDRIVHHERFKGAKTIEENGKVVERTVDKGQGEISLRLEGGVLIMRFSSFFNKIF